jgi:hypothetical protein
MKTLIAKTSFLSLSALIFLSFATTALADCLVTNTNDSGPGSLRQAIMDSNNQLCSERIDFNINNHDAGPFSIAVLPTSMGGGGPLPIISNPVTIDGFTQAGNGFHAIELSGELFPTATTAPFGTVAPTTSSSGFPAGLLLVGRDPVTGNKLPTDPSGSVIRGLTINKFPRSAIYLYGVDNTTIVGNYLGLDVTGELSGYWNDRDDIATNYAVFSNDVRLEGSTNNFIGTTAADYSHNTISPANRNVFGASGGFSVAAVDLNFNINTFNTLTCNNSTPDVDPITGSPVSGACHHVLLGSSHNVIQGNYFGLNKEGSRSLGGFCSNRQPPNGTSCLSSNAIYSIPRSAIFLAGAPVTFDVTLPSNLSNGSNVIGGLVPGQGNLISASLSDALHIQAPQTLVRGNIIGLDATGKTDASITGIGSVGINISNTSWGNTVETNIVANSFAGVGLSATSVIIPRGPYGNVVRFNIIGSSSYGTVPAGNLHGGIVVLGDVSSTAIYGNLINFNGINSSFGGIILQGLSVTPTMTFNPGGVSILGNSISSNSGLGIDLSIQPPTSAINWSGDGPTLNNSAGHSSGVPNHGQNFPVLSASRSLQNPALVQVQGTLDSAPNSYYLIQVFSDSTAECVQLETAPVLPGYQPGCAVNSGYTTAFLAAQGQVLIGQIEVLTDANGHASFRFPANLHVPIGSIITSTATSLNVMPDGSSQPSETSEFSQAISLVQKGSAK